MTLAGMTPETTDVKTFIEARITYFYHLRRCSLNSALYAVEAPLTESLAVFDRLFFSGPRYTVGGKTFAETKTGDVKVLS